MAIIRIVSNRYARYLYTCVFYLWDNYLLSVINYFLLFDYNDRRIIRINRLHFFYKYMQIPVWLLRLIYQMNNLSGNSDLYNLAFWKMLIIKDSISTTGQCSFENVSHVRYHIYPPQIIYKYLHTTYNFSPINSYLNRLTD